MKRGMRAIVGSVLCAAGLAGELGAQTASGPVRPEGVALADAPPPVRVMVGRRDAPAFRVAPPAAPADQPRAAGFTIRYLAAGEVNHFGDVCVGWPEASKAAFSYAANVWAGLLHSTVPIVISACWADMGTGGILGHGGARSYYRDFAGAPQAATYFPVAAANAICGSDLNGSREEMVIAYNNQFSDWYFGADGQCPPSRIDFAQVVLHEMCHGLGFIGSMQVYNGLGSWSYFSDGLPVIYDLFAANGSSQRLLDFPNNSAALAAQLRSGNVYFSGANAVAANGGNWVKLYAPSTWKPGSSYAHLDELFNGTPNALMTYSVNYGESVHHPGPVTLGLLKDVGWPAGQEPTLWIRANGESAAAITLTTADPLAIDIGLEPGDSLGANKDWWIVAVTTYGMFYLDAYTMTWQAAADFAALRPSYQGPLFGLPPTTTVLSLPGLAPGEFHFYFGIDARNGLLDPDVLYSAVRVTVQ